MAKALTEKQAAFVQAKLQGLSNEKAAIQAGYSLRGAQQQGHALMRHPDVAKALRNARVARGKAEAKASRTVAKGVARGDSMSQIMHDVGIDEGDRRLKDHYDTPLDMFLDVMNNPRFPDGTRIECGKQAMPYVNGKVGDIGKKAATRKRAEDIVAKPGAEPTRRNKFAPKPPPTRGNVVQLRQGTKG